MRAKLNHLSCLALATLAFGAGPAGPASAQERLVMPFACTNHGGQVSLTKSAPQTYEIYGQREHKRLTTCSPYDRRNCHTWFVHRFDLDCGGVRTSWQSVVTALSRAVSQRLGAGPAGRSHRGQPPFAYGPRGRGFGGGPVIDFPPGFAPNPMKIARFERTEIALAPLPPKKPISAEPGPAEPVMAEPGPTEPIRTAEAAPDSGPPAPYSSTGETDAAGNMTDAEPAPDAAEAAETIDRTLHIETVDQGTEATGSLPPANTLWRDAGTVFAVTLAVLLALTTLLLLRRRRFETEPVETLPAGTVPGPVTGLPAERVGGSGLARRAAHEGAESHRTEDRRAEAQQAKTSAQSDSPPTRLRLWDEDWLPATMTEALDVLGVDPQAGRDMMKTTVTRLRRALHPDHAIDDEDRALRERRLKQINVAWDIVSGKRRALWFSAKPRPS